MAEVVTIGKKEDPAQNLVMEMGKSFAMSKINGMGSGPKKEPELKIEKTISGMDNPRDRRMAMGVV